MQTVHVFTDQGKQVIVDGEVLDFDFKLPEVFPDDFFYLTWADNFHGYVTAKPNNPFEQVKHELEPTEENYQKYVQPFVDLFEAEKERIEAIENSLENRQKIALEVLNAKFEEAKINSHVKSSLGFTIDANSTANENINGLLVTTKNGEVVYFCDYNNEVHEVTIADLETMREEVIKNAQNLYNQKWAYRSAINDATDSETVNEIIETINFGFLDFTV